MRIARGARVYLDANIIIYTVEEPRPLSPRQRELIASIDSGTLVGVTSELTVAECLVHPFEIGDRKRIEAYDLFLTPSARFELWPVSRDILVTAARIRADLRTPLPDAIHAATALASHSTIVMTNDKSFRAPRDVEVMMWETL